MSILSKLFSGGAADLVKGVGGVIDSLHTSKEEKLNAERKIKALIVEHEAKMEQNITDRWASDMLELFNSLLKKSGQIYYN